MTAFNVFMAIFFVGLFGGLVLLMRHFAENQNQIGEARFDTRNKGDIGG